MSEYTAGAGWDMACRTMGACRLGAPIDREFGNMVSGPDAADFNWTGPKQFTYVRYDLDVSQAGLNDLGFNSAKAENVQVMDSVKYIPDIQKTGAATCKKCDIKVI